MQRAFVAPWLLVCHMAPAGLSASNSAVPAALQRRRTPLIICAEMFVIDFHQTCTEGGGHTQSNLGGVEPDTGAEKLRFGDVGTVDDRTVELVVTGNDTYAVHEKWETGCKENKHHFTAIALENWHTIELKFIDDPSFEYSTSPSCGSYCMFYCTSQARTFTGGEYLTTDSSVSYANPSSITYLPSPPPSPPPPPSSPPPPSPPPPKPPPRPPSACITYVVLTFWIIFQWISLKSHARVKASWSIHSPPIHATLASFTLASWLMPLTGQLLPRAIVRRKRQCVAVAALPYVASNLPCATAQMDAAAQASCGPYTAVEDSSGIGGRVAALLQRMLLLLLLPGASAQACGAYTASSGQTMPFSDALYEPTRGSWIDKRIIPAIDHAGSWDSPDVPTPYPGLVPPAHTLCSLLQRTPHADQS